MSALAGLQCDGGGEVGLADTDRAEQDDSLIGLPIFLANRALAFQKSPDSLITILAITQQVTSEIQPRIDYPTQWPIIL